MSNFSEEIKKLSELHNQSESNEINYGEQFDALKVLYDITSRGVDQFNQNSALKIKLHELHPDLMPLFFNFQSDCSGFVIRTESKFIFVMQSVNNQIFIYGLASQNGVDIRQSMTRAVQLFKLESKDEDGIRFYDSTDRELQAEEIIIQLLSWGLS